jgi:tryptophan synthase alpha chain
VAKYSSGFVYLVSRTGVTGERSTISDRVGPLVQAMRDITDLPLTVGFGISTAEHVRAIGSLVEAVAVGSAFVRSVEQHADDPAPALEALARELASGFPSKGR